MDANSDITTTTDGCLGIAPRPPSDVLNKRAILLVRASELNTQDKVQGLFKAFGAEQFMTPDLAMSILSEAKKAENAAYGETVKRIKEPFGLLNKGHGRARKKKRR